MRIICTVACGLLALICVQKAVGFEPQYLVGDSWLWVWWLFAAAWLYNAAQAWREWPA